MKWPMAKGQRAALGADPVSFDFPKKCCCASFFKAALAVASLHYDPCSLERKERLHLHITLTVRVDKCGAKARRPGSRCGQK